MRIRKEQETRISAKNTDSGIELLPKAKKQRNRNRHRARMQTSARKKPISSIKEHLVDSRREDAKQNAENLVVSGLWLIVLYFTNLTFGLPLQILWPARINHAAVALSYMLIGVWVLCALFFFIFRKRSSTMKWYKTNPKTYYFAWIVQLMGFALFCISTYPQIHRWSYLVSIFYFSFFATISNTFL